MYLAFNTEDRNKIGLLLFVSKLSLCSDCLDMSGVSSSDESCMDECHDVGNIDSYNIELVLKQPRIADSESFSNNPGEENTRLGLLAYWLIYRNTWSIDKSEMKYCFSNNKLTNVDILL